MAKVTKVLDDGKITGLKFEEYRQEDDPSWLALRLAEHMTGAANKQTDYESHCAASANERQKAQQLQFVIFQLKEIEAGNKMRSKSRMDPLNFYELDKCEEEYELMKQRAIDLQGQADEFASEARHHRAEAEKIQRKIISLR